jgi:tripartite-type tricarboxylate transporter receptor subunit TctC
MASEHLGLSKRQPMRWDKAMVPNGKIDMKGCRGQIKWVLSLMGIAWAAWSSPLEAQIANWPQRPVKMVVSASAGSAPDIIARLMGERLGQQWGTQVVIDNRPGAGGNLGAQATARAAPDGYTLWFAHATPVVMNQSLFKNPGFNASKDFTAIVRIGVNPMMIAVSRDVPANNLKELIDLSRSKAGKFSFATSGAKNIPHLVGESLNQLTHMNMLNVPYKGSQQAAQDVASGLAEVYIDAVPPMVPWIGNAAQPGRLKPLAIFANQRIPGFEHLPTARENGIDLTLQGWMGIFAPAGTPAHVVDRVAQDVNHILKHPEIIQRLRILGTYDLGGSTSEFDAFILQERKRWESVVRDAKITAE